MVELKINPDTITLLEGPFSNKKYKRIKLPELFLKWQSEARLKMFDMMKTHGAQNIRSQPAHLPVMATLGNDEFANLSTKGIGLIPKPDLVEKYAILFEKAKSDTSNLTTEKSLPKRVGFIREFYADINNFDPFSLGGLEIFEGNTAKNLKEKGLASLLYTGEAPKFPSYQIDGVVQIVDINSQYYRFLLAARELFAFDAFHIHQVRYPFGYLFYPVQLKDKTPFPKR